MDCVLYLIAALPILQTHFTRVILHVMWGTINWQQSGVNNNLV